MKFDNKIRKIDKIIIFFDVIKKFLRGLYYRIFMSSVKGILLVGKRVKISHAAHIKVGKWVKFEDGCEIQGLSSEGIKLGDYVTIGKNVMIRPSSYYGIDCGKGLVIGNNSSIGPDSYIGCSGKIIIGNNVMFGPKCSLFAENHIFLDNISTIKSQGVRQKGILIEDDCWIGSNVIILDGVTIGKGCVIGAGTIITKDIQPYTIIIDKRIKSVKER